MEKLRIPSKPGRSNRQVAFDVEDDEGEVEVDRRVQWRCVCLPLVVFYAVISRLANLCLGRVQ